MGASVYKFTGLGAGAVAVSAPALGGGQSYRLVSVTARCDVAPVSAGSLTVTLNASEGSDYDVVLETQSMIGLTSYVWLPDQDFFILPGDSVDVAYANPDSRVCGVRVTLKAV